MATAKKIGKPIYLQFHFDGVCLTTTVKAASIEDAMATGREMRLTDVVNLDGAEWVDGDIHLTGVYES